MNSILITALIGFLFGRHKIKQVNADKGSVAVGGDNHGTINNVSGNLIIGITLEQYEAGLKRKEQEMRDELAHASTNSPNSLAGERAVGCTSQVTSSA